MKINGRRMFKDELSPPKEDEMLQAFDGIKTYIAAAGLFGLSVYQLSTNDFTAACTSFMAGLAAVGLRHAVAKNSNTIKDVADEAQRKKDF